MYMTTNRDIAERSHLTALLEAMTPTQQAAFVTIQTAISDGLISPAEQSAAITTARQGGEKWNALLTDLRLRARRMAGGSRAQ